VQIAAILMEGTNLVKFKTSVYLCLRDGIVSHACCAFAVHVNVAEVGPSTWVRAFAGQTFGAVLDLGLLVAAEVDGKYYFAHVELLDLRTSFWGVVV
jgi:hypothetical protein